MVEKNFKCMCAHTNAERQQDEMFGQKYFVLLDNSVLEVCIVMQQCSCGLVSLGCLIFQGFVLLLLTVLVYESFTSSLPCC